MWKYLKRPEMESYRIELVVLRSEYRSCPLKWAIFPTPGPPGLSYRLSSPQKVVAIGPIPMYSRHFSLFLIVLTLNITLSPSYSYKSILYIQFTFSLLVKYNLKHVRVIDSEMVAKVSHRKKVLQSHCAF